MLAASREGCGLLSSLGYPILPEWDALRAAMPGWDALAKRYDI